jgi:hypothetical protein
MAVLTGATVMQGLGTLIHICGRHRYRSAPTVIPHATKHDRHLSLGGDTNQTTFTWVHG